MGSQVAKSAAVFLLICIVSPMAWCYDQQVSSDLYAEGYSVPAADGADIPRRNIVEDLHLAAWNLLPGSDDPYYQGPRLSIEMNLRLMGDLGITGEEYSKNNPGNHVPGLTPFDVEAVFAYVDAQGIFDGAMDIRAGRQIRLDTVGFFAFDGVETGFHMPGGVGMSAFIGYQVQGGKPLGYDALELDGTDDGGLDGLDSEFYPDRSDPPLHLSFGSELTWTPVHWFDSAAGVRIVGLNGEMVEQRLGARFAIGNERVRSFGRVIINPMMDRTDNRSAAMREGTYVSSAEASVAVSPFNETWISVGYDLYRPVFVADSIFNVFDLIPKRNLELRVEKDIARRLSIAAWGFLRLSDESAGLDGSDNDALLAGAGGGTGANYHARTRELSTRITAQREWGETSLGLEMGGRHGLARNRLWLGLRGSFWHIEDTLSPHMSGNIVGYIATLQFRIAKMASVIGEFENYFGGGRSARFATLAILRLDLWR